MTPGARITPITSDGSRYIVNGTFDWVYEEELFCRDGWRWSPDSQHIAYWQLNSEGVKEFQLVNNTEGLYPVITSFPYPKAGETNSAARVGVVSASGGATRWFDIAGDPRNNYLPRMEWAASSDEVVIQQLNRIQNTNIVMLGDIRSVKVRPILTEKDDTWVDISWGDLDWNKTGLARGDRCAAELPRARDPVLGEIDAADAPVGATDCPRGSSGDGDTLFGALTQLSAKSWRELVQSNIDFVAVTF